MRIRAAVRCLVPLGFAVACGPVQPPSATGAPVNACSESACAAYEHSGPAPSCASGVCVVPVSLTDVIFVIQLAEDSYFAPQGTFVVPHDNLGDPPSTPSMMPCVWPTCGHLPAGGGASGSYLMAPSAQSPPSAGSQGVGFYLGNANSSQGNGTTALPVAATYRMLQDPWGHDVVALGLPIRPVQAESYVIAEGSYPGPQGGPTFAYQTYLEPGMYERTLLPDSPFDAVFGPEVRSLAVPASFDADIVTGFDVTKEEPGLGTTLPTFDISRAEGLDGWSAYLRDATTLQIISNVRSLGGNLAQSVLLVTNRPGMADALTNAELVVAPPTGGPIPTGVFPNNGQELPAQLTYPPLPQPVTMTGTIVSADGAPAAADLVFEALAITDPNGLNPTNFEFVGYASARPSTPAGAAAYSVLLPPGQYRIDVRPVDATSAVTIADVLVDVSPSPYRKDFTVLSMSEVQGTAVVKDGRPLSGATVEALPTQCFTPPAAADSGAMAATTPASSPSCLPRPGQAVTAADGRFRLPLDPGSYILRVRPASGTRLPWVTQSATLEVPSGSGAKALPPVAFSVPAPVDASMVLLDPIGNAIVNAVVRAFAMPAQTTSSTSPPPPAVELGQAITDANGHYDLYVALPE